MVEDIIKIAEGWDGSSEQKAKFHRLCKKYLQSIAGELGMKVFEIRKCLGGPAVLGETILHSDNLYIQLGGSYTSPSFMYRRCKGLKDYSGGTNNWAAYRELTDRERILRRFRNPLV